MKYLARTKFCLGLQLEHLHMSILIYRSAYVQKILKSLIWIKSIQLELLC
jgi:hypothetical protein